MYYLRTLPAANAIQFTVKKVVLKEKNTDEKELNEVSNSLNDAKLNEAGDTNGLSSNGDEEGCLMCSG